MYNYSRDGVGENCITVEGQVLRANLIWTLAGGRRRVPVVTRDGLGWSNEVRDEPASETESARVEPFFVLLLAIRASRGHRRNESGGKKGGRRRDEVHQGFFQA